MLLKLHQSDNSAAQIADALASGLGSTHSRNSVIGKLNRMGLGLPNGRKGGRKHEKTGRKHEKTGRKVGGIGPSGLHIATKRHTAATNLRPEPKLIAEPVTETNVTLSDLEEGMCSWPVRDGFYCGGATENKRVSYCPAHKLTSLDKPRMQRYNENYQKSRSVIKRGRTFRGY